MTKNSPENELNPTDLLAAIRKRGRRGLTIQQLVNQLAAERKLGRSEVRHLLRPVLKSLQRQGRKARLLYLVPTFNNPSGTTLNIERRRQLVKLAREYDLLVVEDDVYHQLWYDAAPPPSIYSLAPAENIIRLGSFSKILAPGLRLGWMQAAPEIIQRCVDSGVFESGGGVGQFTSHVVAAFIELGLLEQQVKILRKEYGRRRDILLNALKRLLPEKCYFDCHSSGYFSWILLKLLCDFNLLNVNVQQKT